MLSSLDFRKPLRRDSSLALADNASLAAPLYAYHKQDIFESADKAHDKNKSIYLCRRQYHDFNARSRAGAYRINEISPPRSKSSCCS